MTIRRKATVVDHLRKFEEGQLVHVAFQPDIPNKGYPYLNYHGKTGQIVGKRGSAYIVQFRDKDAVKKMIVRAVHMKPAGLEESASPAQKGE
jgi:large subunit ribosomal protein L21e